MEERLVLSPGVQASLRALCERTQTSPDTVIGEALMLLERDLLIEQIANEMTSRRETKTFWDLATLGRR